MISTTTTSPTYRAEGSVRGMCGHNHRTYEAAERCAVRDRLACAGLPGGNAYSDRDVWAYVDGERVPADEAELHAADLEQAR